MTGKGKQVGGSRDKTHHHGAKILCGDHDGIFGGRRRMVCCGCDEEVVMGGWWSHVMMLWFVVDDDSWAGMDGPRRCLERASVVTYMLERTDDRPLGCDVCVNPPKIPKGNLLGVLYS